MGGLLVSERVNIGVDVLQKSVNATANWVFQLLLRIAHLRGLAPDNLISKRQKIEDGLFTWIGEQKLDGVSIEIYDPSTGQAIERFDFEFSYRADADPNVCEPNVARVEEFCQTLRAVPSGCDYDIIATTLTGATEVPGWRSTEFRPIQIAWECQLSDHGFGLVGTKLIYRGGTW